METIPNNQSAEKEAFWNQKLKECDLITNGLGLGID